MQLLERQYAFRLAYAEALVEDLTDERRRAVPGPGLENHPAFTLGHLCTGSAMAAEDLGLPRDLPEGCPMLRLLMAVLLTASLTMPALANPLAKSRTVNKTGRHGGTLQGQGSAAPVPGGWKGSGSGTVRGPRGGTATGSGTFRGNRNSGQAQGQGSWNGRRSTGNASGSGTWSNGTATGSGEVEATSKKTGKTYDASGNATYNKDTGGSAAVTTPKGTKTRTLRPVPK